MERSVILLDGAYFAKILKSESGEPRVDSLKLSPDLRTKHLR